MFKPEEPSPSLTPEREATRQLLNKEERKMVAAMERDLVRPLTEEEERWFWNRVRSSSSRPLNNSGDEFRCPHAVFEGRALSAVP